MVHVLDLANNIHVWLSVFVYERLLPCFEMRTEMSKHFRQELRCYRVLCIIWLFMYGTVCIMYRLSGINNRQVGYNIGHQAKGIGPTDPTNPNGITMVITENQRNRHR